MPRVIVEVASVGSVVVGLRIPNSADLLFRESSAINEESLASLRQAMVSAEETLVQIEDGSLELQVSSRIVHAAIVDALLRRLRNPIVEHETMRFD